jgi:hypothetical protein
MYPSQCTAVDRARKVFIEKPCPRLNASRHKRRGVTLRADTAWRGKGAVDPGGLLAESFQQEAQYFRSHNGGPKGKIMPKRECACKLSSIVPAMVQKVRPTGYRRTDNGGGVNAMRVFYVANSLPTRSSRSYQH